VHGKIGQKFGTTLAKTKIHLRKHTETKLQKLADLNSIKVHS
jgi:hypothetical protein